MRSFQLEKNSGTINTNKLGNKSVLKQSEKCQVSCEKRRKSIRAKSFAQGSGRENVTPQKSNAIAGSFNGDGSDFMINCHAINFHLVKNFEFPCTYCRETENGKLSVPHNSHS